jgi:hypothetical protein
MDFLRFMILFMKHLIISIEMFLLILPYKRKKLQRQLLLELYTFASLPDKPVLAVCSSLIFCQCHGAAWLGKDHFRLLADASSPLSELILRLKLAVIHKHPANNLYWFSLDFVMIVL